MMLSGQALAMTLGQWIVLAGGGPRQPVPVAVKQLVRRSSCRRSGCTTSRCRWMDSAPARGKAWTPRSGMREPGCTSGSSRPVPSAPCRASPAAAPASTTRSPAPGNRASAPRSWAGASSFRTPVFVLTHHPRPSVQMNGGTTFDFLDASPAQALAQARQAAAGADVRIGGGPSTVREFLAAGLIDYLHIVVVPIVLGRGERLWDGLGGLEERFQIEAVNSPSGVTHVTLSRR